MKKLMVLTVLCLPLWLWSQEVRKEDKQYEGIHWTESLSWDEVKAKAKTENKYIFMDCFATWCGPCKMMDRDVYPQTQAGKAMNEKFINIKVQMDSTAEDSQAVRKWHADAQQIMKDYKVGGFPTYLFFSPDGNLVHREVGYQSIQDFVRLSGKALDPKKIRYYALYEGYKKGKEDFSVLKDLTFFTRDLIGDKETAKAMAKDYKSKILDNLDSKSLLTKENINFLFAFADLITSKDKLFQVALKNAELIDTLRHKGEAMRIVQWVIQKEELANKTQVKGKGVNKFPDWNKLENRIVKKYPSIDAKKMMLDYKVQYYQWYYKDWQLWAQYRDEQIKTYPPKPPYGLTVYWEINGGGGGAWYVFLNCSDTAVLQKALEWVDLAIEIDKEEIGKTAAYYDTKANLLYKLGRKKDAITFQKEAADLQEKIGSNRGIYQVIYEQMLKGEPTYVDQGAIWDKASLARIAN